MTQSVPPPVRFPVFQLVRPGNLMLAAGTVVVAALLAGAQWVDVTAMVIAWISCVCMAAAAYALNDVYDVESDRVNHPERPLVTGTVSVRQARAVWLVATILSILIASLGGTTLILLSVIGTALLVLYNMWLTRVAVFGNIIAAGATSLAVYFGAAVMQNFEAAKMPALFAFLANLAREMIKDVEDSEGDRAANARTLPILFGRRRALRASVVPIVLLIAATIEPYVAGHYGGYYLAIVAVADVMLLSCIVIVLRSPSTQSLRRVSLGLKLSMVVGILALFAAGW